MQGTGEGTPLPGSIFLMDRAKDPFLRSEMQMIHKIIRDETWLEGERRGKPVEPSDPVVRERVCQVVLRVGAQMRAAASARCAAG